MSAMEQRNWEEQLNTFLVEVFNDILKTEEAHATRDFADLSLRELHLIEAVCLAVDAGRDNRASAIAAAQRVTAGTLTTVVNQLEKKGYLERVRDGSDKRSVRLFPTEKGRQANARHTEVHREMVANILEILTPEETVALLRGLGGIAAFFRERYHQA